MNYLSVEGLTKSFGERTLFSGLTFGIDQGQKVAIVAKNGNGKTTLLRCLMGLESHEEGRVTYRKEIRVAFMQQTEQLPEDLSILDAVFSGDDPMLSIVIAYDAAMESGDDKKIAESYDLMSEHQLWDLEVRVKQILSVLKLENHHQLVDLFLFHS